MSGKGKAKGLGSGPPGGSKSQRAGLTFPVGRIGRWMKEGAYATRIGKGAPIFLAAVLEYLTYELLEMAGGHARESAKRRITPQHIQYAIRNDSELASLLSSVIIAKGGVNPMTSEVAAQPRRGSREEAPKEEEDF